MAVTFSSSTTEKREYLAERIEAHGVADLRALSSLRDYQVEGAFELEQKRRFLLLDTMGLGKTIQTIVALQALGSFNTLITSRRSTLSVWQDEMEKWWPACQLVSWEGSPKKRENIWTNYQSLTCTRALLVTMDTLASLPSKHFISTIVDECHKAKGRNTKRFKNLQQIRSENLFQLTGTPTSHSGADLFTYLNLIDPKNFGSFWNFVTKYFACEQGEWGELKVLAVKKPEEFRELMQRYALRREKDVAGLPPKTLQAIRVDLPPATRRLYDEFRKTRLIEYEDTVLMASTPLVRTTRERQLLVSPRILGFDLPSPAIDATTEITCDALDGGESVGIFTPFRGAIPFIQEALIRGGVREDQIFVVEAGGSDTVASFQRAPKEGVIISTQAMAESWTATKASVGIACGYDWSPVTNQQAEDRLHRIGQKRGVIFYYILNRNTLDDHVMDVLNGKTTWHNLVTRAAQDV
jgi:SNF2 family DNA or RNA helicase